MKMLTGQNVVVVGGNGLIGQGLVKAALAQGANVVCASRSPNPELFSDLDASEQDRLTFSAVNLSDGASIDAMLEQLSETHVPIHSVVNCSFPRNASYGAKFEDVTFEGFCDNVNLHLGGAFLLCQKFVRYFETVGEGNIINFSSIYGVMAPRFELYEGTDMTKEVEYAVCKSAIIQLTRYLATYLKGKNIRVNCVSPGGVFNNQDERFVRRYESHCLNKGMLEANDVAETVMFLLSDSSRAFNGQNFILDDGFSL